MNKVFAFIILVLFSVNISHAQLTIGSAEAPVGGTILQLKNLTGMSNGAVNSSKGLVLPRLTLTDLYSLTDIAISVLTETANMYTGLVVYHIIDTTNCSYISPAGPYVWSGSVWKSFSNSEQWVEDPKKVQLRALQKILDDNPNNTIGWTIDTVDVDNPSNYSLGGVTWEGTGCNKRITTLVLDLKSLSSLNVSALTSLQSLSCRINSLTSLDISGCTSLVTLDCAANTLTSLDVHTNTSLTTLNCQTNQLASLTVSGATSLTSLTCTSNLLNSLDVSTNTALTTLDVRSNKLTSLDVRTNTSLEALDCSSNLLNSLDVSTNTALKTLTCSNNSLSSLDLTSNILLTRLRCDLNSTLVATSGSVTVCQTTWDNWSSSTTYINPVKTSNVYNKLTCE